MKTPTYRKVFTVATDVVLAARLQQHADAAQVPVAAMIRCALEHFLTYREKPRRAVGRPKKTATSS